MNLCFDIIVFQKLWPCLSWILLLQKILAMHLNVTALVNFRNYIFVTFYDLCFHKSSKNMIWSHLFSYGTFSVQVFMINVNFRGQSIFHHNVLVTKNGFIRMEYYSAIQIMKYWYMPQLGWTSKTIYRMK
jgi:hypothetical protein